MEAKERNKMIKEKQRKITKGNRNNELLKFISSTFKKFKDKNKLLSLACIWNKENCLSLLPENEIEAMIDNLLFKKGK